MALKLMYITNNPEIALIAENAGVDRVFIDMEYIGKELRQGGMDTVKCHHTINDIKNIGRVIKKSELLVRCNPIHNATEDYISSKEEIDAIVDAGADIIMLPFFKTIDELKTFIKIVDNRVRILPLIETPEAVEIIDEITRLDGINEIFVGLNDLSLGYKKKFMFELLVDGTIEKLARKFREERIPFGFGGIASIGKGELPSEKIIIEHYRLGSTCAILSRSFCNANKMTDISAIKEVFDVEVMKIREFEKEVDHHSDWFADNSMEVKQRIDRIIHKEN